MTHIIVNAYFCIILQMLYWRIMVKRLEPTTGVHSNLYLMSTNSLIIWDYPQTWRPGPYSDNFQHIRRVSKISYTNPDWRRWRTSTMLWNNKQVAIVTVKCNARWQRKAAQSNSTNGRVKPQRDDQIFNLSTLWCREITILLFMYLAIKQNSAKY